jgi:hypothetical protein
MTVHCLSCICIQNEYVDGGSEGDLKGDGSEKGKLETNKNSFQIDKEKIEIKLTGKVGVLSEDIDKNPLCVFGPGKLSFKTTGGVMIGIKSWKLAIVNPFFKDVSKVNICVMTMIIETVFAELQ